MKSNPHLRNIRLAMFAAAMGAASAAKTDAATLGIHFRYAYQYSGTDYIESTINTAAGGLVAGIPAINWNNMSGIDEGQGIYPTSYTAEALTSPDATGVTVDFSAQNSYQTTYPMPDQSDPSFAYVSYLDDSGSGYSVTLHGLTSVLAPGEFYRVQALQSSDNATSFADVKVYQGTSTAGTLLATLTNPTTGSGAIYGNTNLSGLLSDGDITIVGTARVGSKRSTLAGLIITTVSAPDHFFDEGVISYPFTNLGSGKTSHFRIGTPGDTVTITGTNALNIAATHTIDIGAVGAVTPGTYTLIDYDGTLGGAGFAGLALGTKPHMSATLNHNTGNTSIELVVSSVETVTWSGSVNSVWNVNSTNNWTINGSPGTYFQGDTLVFDDTATTAGTITLAADMSPGAILFNNSSKNYALTGATLTGPATLTKSGTGTVTLLSDNTLTGIIDIQAGTLAVGNGGATGALGAPSSIFLSSGATLEFNLSSPLSLARTVGGSVGTLVKNGTGTLTVSSTDNTADIVINSGTFAARGGSWSASFAANRTITVNAGGILDTTTHSLGGLGGAIRPSSIVLNEDGVWMLNNEQYLLSSTIMTAGTINGPGEIRGGGTVTTLAHATKSSTINSPVNLVGTVTFAVADGAVPEDLVITGNVYNSGGLTKTGAGSLTLSGNNTFTGTLSITGGTVSAATFNSAPLSGPLGQGAVQLNGATLVYTGSTDVTDREITFGASGGTIGVADPATNLTYSANIAGNAVTKSGPGTLTLNAFNSQSSTTILAGTLVPISDVTLGTGGVTVTGGQLDLNGVALSPANTVAVGVSGAVIGSGTMTLNGNVAGTLAPGNGGVGHITTSNALTLNATAVCNLQIGGLGASNHDVIEAQSSISLAGTVNVSLTNGFTPALGNSFDLFVEDGSFASTASLNLPPLPGGLAWNTAAFATSGVISVETATPAVAYASSFGLTGNNALPGADPDGDGISNALEYAFQTSPIANNGPEYRGVASTTSGALSLTYRRPLNGVSGVSYGVEFKTADLVVGNTGWSTGVLNTHYTQSVTPNGDGTTETVVINLIGPVSGKKFARVAVTY